jgi:hypothetical protein
MTVKDNPRAWFIGAQGIRAGWSMLIFVAIVAAQILLTRVPVNRLLHSMNERQSLQSWAGVVSAGILSLVVLIATAIMAMIEKRPLLSYGFEGQHRLRRFVAGVAGGVAALSALVLTLKLSGLLIFDGQALHGTEAWSLALKWGAAFLLTGCFEESLVRGYLQYTLARGVGFWWAALLLSVGFGAAHLPNQGESPIGILSTVAIGLVFCWSLKLTKSLYWAVGLHAGWDWSQSFLYGVPDSGRVISGHLFTTHPAGGVLWSGGLTGPEGSIFIVPTVAAITLGVWIAWGRSDRRAVE